MLWGFLVMKRNTEVSNTPSIDIEKLCTLAPYEVYAFLDSSENGLSEELASNRLQQYGPNTLKREKTFHPIKRFAKQLVNFMAIMLWMASILAIVAGTPILSYVIWGIILINGIFSFIQESRADNALQALAAMMPNNVKVYRSGALKMLSAEQLVPGDVVVLKAGDKVPADIRIVQANSLFVDNSMLTGESIAVDRNEEPDQLNGQPITNSGNLLFAGTSVTGGNALGVVYVTADQTQIGGITQTSSHIVRNKSTLELQIHKITRTLIFISFILGFLAFMISKFVTGIELNAALIFAIGIIVANIPEGLMPTVSLSLAMGVQRMAKKNALVRKQSAVETLGSTTVICTDKTGTLTQNAMSAKKIWTIDSVFDITGDGYQKKGTITGVTEENKHTLETCLTAATICSDTVLHTAEDKPDEWHIIGNPTEAAILIAAEKYGMSTDNVKASFERLQVIPFSSATKQMTVIARDTNDRLVQFTKGDPARVTEHCKYVLKDGKKTPFTDDLKAMLYKQHDTFANEGFRLLAIAYCDNLPTLEPKIEDLTFIGFVVMYDPPKEGVIEAIQGCYRAGIRITVVTGDYSLTAAAIAKQIGIVRDEYIVITGAELTNMSQQELAQKIDTTTPVIFARTTPSDKLKIVETYQSLGHIVATTGDGLNDVLALRKADIGIAMGKHGSDAAIESSDIVLLDDNFKTIVEAVKEGRAIYSNIQKFITYILASNIPEVMPFLAMGIFNLPLALTVLLVLAIDLGTDLIPAISLGEEHPDDDVLDAPPRKVHENILNRNVLLRSYGFLGMIEAGLLFVMFFFAWNSFGYSLDEIRSFTAAIANGTASEEIMYVYSYAITLAFGAVIAAQIGNVLQCRSPKQSMIKSFSKKNNLIVWGIVVEILLFLAISYVPFIQNIFGTEALQLKHLALLIICPIVLIIFEEIRKLIVRKSSLSTHAL